MDFFGQLSRCTGFQWDEGNLLKIWERHGVSAAECEQAFFNRPLVVEPDEKHSSAESRFYALGHTDTRRLLFVVFTIRGEFVRIISARDYESAREEDIRGIMKKKLPEFSSEDQERGFWAREDSTAYVDWSKGKRAVLPRLKPSLKVISLRLPDVLLAELKVLANKRDVPYQSLLKMFLAERIEQELQDSESRKPGRDTSLQRRNARR
jgi:uncharacterized DUF497 family protein